MSGEANRDTIVVEQPLNALSPIHKSLTANPSPSRLSRGINTGTNLTQATETFTGTGVYYFKNVYATPPLVIGLSKTISKTITDEGSGTERPNPKGFYVKLIKQTATTSYKFDAGSSYVRIYIFDLDYLIND